MDNVIQLPVGIDDAVSSSGHNGRHAHKAHFWSNTSELKGTGPELRAILAKQLFILDRIKRELCCIVADDNSKASTSVFFIACASSRFNVGLGGHASDLDQSCSSCCPSGASNDFADKR